MHYDFCGTQMYYLEINLNLTNCCGGFAYPDFFTYLKTFEKD